MLNEPRLYRLFCIFFHIFPGVCSDLTPFLWVCMWWQRQLQTKKIHWNSLPQAIQLWGCGWTFSACDTTTISQQRCKSVKFWHSVEGSWPATILRFLCSNVNSWHLWKWKTDTEMPCYVRDRDFQCMVRFHRNSVAGKLFHRGSTADSFSDIGGFLSSHLRNAVIPSLVLSLRAYYTKYNTDK